MRAYIDIIESQHHKHHHECKLVIDGVGINLQDYEEIDEGKEGPVMVFSEGLDDSKQQTVTKAVQQIRNDLRPYHLEWLLNCRVEVKVIGGDTAGLYTYPNDLITVDPRFDDDLHVVAHECGHRFLAKSPNGPELRAEVDQRFKRHMSQDFTTAYSKTSPDEFWAEAFAACVEKTAPAPLAQWVKQIVS